MKVQHNYSSPKGRHNVILSKFKKNVRKKFVNKLKAIIIILNKTVDMDW